MWTKLSSIGQMKHLLASLAFLAASATAFANGTMQDHHCKGTDGVFDPAKTEKQCVGAKGEWVKDRTLSGVVKSGVKSAANPGGIEVSDVTSKQDYFLDVHGDAVLMKAVTNLNSKTVRVTGYEVIKPENMIPEQHYFYAVSIVAKK